jgi:hypothetical protein
MTSLGRRRQSALSAPRRGAESQQKARQKSLQRRTLLGEQLEPRQLMAGDVMPTLSRSAFWNVSNPKDVNTDGVVTAFDALSIINDLNRNGARSLTTASGASAGESSNPADRRYVDVNNDGKVTAMDALSVINRLNSGSAGEGDPLVEFSVDIVASGTNDPITSIAKGEYYEMRILAKDLGVLSYMGDNRDEALGVFTTYVDVLFNTSNTSVQINDVQEIAISPTPSSGTFRLTVNDNGTLKTTADITWNSSRLLMRRDIQDALNAALGPDSVEVYHEGGSAARWQVRFINRMSNTDVPDVTISNNSLNNGAAITITELVKGDVNSNAAFQDAVALRERYDASGFPINSPLYLPNTRAGFRMAGGIDNLGGVGGQFGPFAGLEPAEVGRIRMRADDAGVVTFSVSLDDIPEVLGTGVHGFENPVSLDLMTFVTDTLTITSPLTAGDDSVTIDEGRTATIDINVISNDVNPPPTPSTNKTVTAVTQPAVGSAAIVNNQIRYTPPGGDFNGPVTFTYTVQDQAGNTDTATVTVNIAPVNDAPVITGPNTQTFNEDTSRVFSLANGNQITLNDVDSGLGLLTMTLNVGPGNGSLTLGSVTGLTNLFGNGTNSITVQGTATDLHAALQGLTYTPVPDANGTVTLAIAVNDNGNTGSGGALNGTKNITLNITPINDGPSVNLGFAGDQLVIEGDPLTFSSGNSTQITVSDPDAGTSNVVVTLSTNTAGTIIHVPTTPNVLIGTNDSNLVTLTGPINDINAALNGFTVTPPMGSGGANTLLTVAINDQGATGGGALTDSEVVTIVVEPSVRPAAKDDVASTDEDISVEIAIATILGNDLTTLPEGTYDAILVSYQGTSVQGGTITPFDNNTPGDTSDDKLIYTPPANYFGPDSFNYLMNDTSGTGLDNEGTVNITVREVNDDPTVGTDSLPSIAEDSGNRTITAATLLGNDSAGPANEASQMLTITGVSNPVGGTVQLVGSNVIFTPTLNFNGTASFDYTIQDNGTTNGVLDAKTATGSVSFTITEVNDEPLVSPNPLVLSAIDEDSGNRTIAFATLLAGATPGGGSDEAGQTLSVQGVTSGTGGTVAISGTDVIFTPQANFHGTASFSYTVADNGTTNGLADPKTRTVVVNFPVNPVNDAPVAGDDSVQTGEEQQVVISVLANDSDVDASATFVSQNGVVSPGTTINIVTPPSSGSATVVGNTIQYTPAVGFFGTVTLQYQLNDNSTVAPTSLTSNIATVTIEVVERNDPPVAVNDPGIVTNEDTSVAIDVFANDSDPDTASSLWTVTITGPANGTAVFNTTTRQIDYTPNANYNGPDSFSYVIHDNSTIAPTNLSSNSALVSINVREVNDAPTANDDANPITGYIVVKDRDRTFTVAELLANDLKGPANESGQTLTITSVSATSAQGGTVSLSGGVITYTAPAGITGPDSFTYTVEDNGTSLGVADPLTDVGQVVINLVEFIPTDVKGYVYLDADNDGVFDANEKPLSGVEITLSGTSQITGAITPITVKTNMQGYYVFEDVEPGTYTLTEQTPFALRDGKETAGAAATLSATNDQINLILPLLGGLPGEESINNFGERGIDTTQLTDSQGMIGEILASSTSTGFVLAADLSGDLFWSWALNGWGGTTSIKVTLDADLSAATLECSNGLQTYTTRIYQNPYDSRNTNSTNPDSVARLARFRLLGHDANGNYIIRLDGKAEHFYGVGTPLAAAAPTSGGEYVEDVDAVMANGSWA